MKFGLFYEIPVPRPRDADAEHRAYKIPHEQVMQTIELMGKHVIPEFNR